MWSNISVLIVFLIFQLHEKQINTEKKFDENLLFFGILEVPTEGFTIILSVFKVLVLHNEQCAGFADAGSCISEKYNTQLAEIP